jgi:hypothetical protein
MNQESLDHVVSGAIFDFMGWLTTRTERLTLSSADDAAPAADAIKEFLTLRGVDLSCEPMIFLWPARCNNGKCRPCQEEDTTETEAETLFRTANSMPCKE